MSSSLSTAAAVCRSFAAPLSLHQTRCHQSSSKASPRAPVSFAITVGRRGGMKSASSSSLVVPRAKNKGSYGDDDAFGGYDNDCDDDDMFGDVYDSASEKSGGGYPANASPFGKKGKKKGAAKKSKRSKYDEDELPPIASDVKRIIRSASKRKPPPGALGSSLDIGSSLDAGDGEGFAPPMDAWRGAAAPGQLFDDVFDQSANWSMDDDDGDVSGSGSGSSDNDDYAAAAPIFTFVPKKKKEEEEVADVEKGAAAAVKAEETKKATVEPADAGKAAKKARQTLCKWGFRGAEVDAALTATDAAPGEGEGQTEFNKKRQVAALDWLLINAPEDGIPVEYKNDAIRARS